MELSREQIESFIEQLPEKVSQGAIVKIFEMLPDNQPMGMIQGVITEALYRIPRDLPDDQIAAKVMEKLNNKAQDHKEGPWNSRKITRDHYDSLLLELRFMDPVIPTTEFQLYGETFSSPIMTAALSHLGNDNMEEYGEGAAMAGCVHWVGMSKNEELDGIIATGARTINIIKPYEDEKNIYSRLEHSQKIGALAVGMDLDHIFTHSGDIDVTAGEKMAIKSSATLKEYIQATNLPFVIKGILSVRDAVKCAEIGAKGIVISHHGGRQKYAVPPLMLLPDIAKELGGIMPIFVDCGIASGMDAYKALALGATAVSVGTHLIPHIRKGGAKAVCDQMMNMTDELRGLMANTGVKDLDSFDPTVIHHRNF